MESSGPEMFMSSQTLSGTLGPGGSSPWKSLKSRDRIVFFNTEKRMKRKQEGKEKKAQSLEKFRKTSDDLSQVYAHSSPRMALPAPPGAMGCLAKDLQWLLRPSSSLIGTSRGQFSLPAPAARLPMWDAEGVGQVLEGKTQSKTN